MIKSNGDRKRRARVSDLVSVLFSEPKIPQTATPQPRGRCSRVSVLFSEPKIPQTILRCGCTRPVSVSVLFSEPKIPQIEAVRPARVDRERFSALQRAENSSNRARSADRPRRCCVSVLFSEPKIPQIRVEQPADDHPLMFQCSSASRKFLKRF